MKHYSDPDVLTAGTGGFGNEWVKIRRESVHRGGGRRGGLEEKRESFHSIISEKASLQDDLTPEAL